MLISSIIISNSERLTNKYSVASIPLLTDINSKTFRNNLNKENENEYQKQLNSKKKDSSFFNNLILYLGSNQYIGHYSRAIDITKQNYLFGSLRLID